MLGIEDTFSEVFEKKALVADIKEISTIDSRDVEKIQVECA